MSTGTDAAQAALTSLSAVMRDYVTDGLPGSGANDPSKPDFRAALLQLSAAFGQLAIDFATASAVRNVLPNCVAATTGNINLATGLVDGTVIDGVTVHTGQDVLVWKQTDATQNGLYAVAASGAASRTAEANTAAKILGAYLYVSGGAASGFKNFALTTQAPITLGTTALSFIQTEDQGAINASAVAPQVAAAAASASSAASSLATVISMSAGFQSRTKGLFHGVEGAINFKMPAGKLIPLYNQNFKLVTPGPGGMEEVLSKSTILGSSFRSTQILGKKRAVWTQVNQNKQYLTWTTLTGDQFVATPDGPRRPNDDYFYSADTIDGRPSVSSLVVDGELIIRFKRNQYKQITEGWGSKGGYFFGTSDGWVRVNSAAYATKPKYLTYTGLAYNGSLGLLPYCVNQAGQAYIFVLMGQSNGDGQNNDTTDTLVSGTAVYPNNALMLQQGASPGGPRYRTASGSAVLVPLIEQTINAGGGSYQQETAVSGWVNHFISAYNAQWSVMPTVVGVSVAIGGRAEVGNGRGQESLEQALNLAATALYAQKVKDIVVVGAWVGSESDNRAGMSELDFMREMRQMRRDFVETVRRTTSMVADPELIMIQPSNTYGSDIYSSPVRNGMRKLDAEYGFTLAAPAYYLPLEGSAGNGIHRTNLGKYTTGMMLGYATYAQICNNGPWHSLKPHEAYLTAANTVVINFDSNGAWTGGNLVLDTSGTITTASGTNNGALANYGFSFDDGSASPPTITAVAVSGYSVTLTLSGAPTGPRKRVGYALAHTGTSTFAGYDGPVYGARGCLRDSVGYTRLSDSSTQYDWAPAFVMSL
jgi:hypothetical protein